MNVLWENIFIAIFGVASVAGGLILITQRNPVRAALGLLLSMASLGMIFLTEGAHFVGFVQLMVYAGAIVILFLFAVMHFPVARLRRDRIPATRVMGFILVVLLGMLLILNLSIFTKMGFLTLPFAPRNYEDTLEIGKRFVFDWIYPFELIGVLLLVAVIAAMHLTRSPGSDNEKEEEVF